MKQLFKTEADINAAKASFLGLKTSAGWQLVVTMLNTDIEMLKGHILDGDVSEEEMKDMRKALKIYEDVVAIPDYWIKRLDTPEQEMKNDDPYYTKESLKKARAIQDN